MNKIEASEVLKKILKNYREKTYSELMELVEEKFNLKHTHYEEVKLENGNWYQVRVNVFWDDKKIKTLRVVGSIDDGGLKAFIPQTDDFILKPDGNFIGE